MLELFVEFIVQSTCNIWKILKEKFQKKAQENIDKYKDIEDEYNKAMNPLNVTYADRVDTKTFGTGFVVVLKDGTNLVITNHHVVQGCSEAIIEFVDSETGKSTVYENLTVHTLGDRLDIAILTFPDGQKPFKKGLTILDDAVTDGDEVWSAGYPGLGTKPAWQFAKGNVTSSKARINELVDSSISTIIQHSAPIAPGNSGGPLLIKDNSFECGYAVVGINTWKASNRELTGFTIPGSVINQVIKFVQDDSANKSVDVVKAKVDRFFGEMNKRYNNSDVLIDYISMHFADTITYAYYKNAKESDLIKYHYVGTYLDEKYDALAQRLWSKYSLINDKKFNKDTDKYNFVSCEKSDDSYIFVYEDTRKENTVTSTWIYEAGLWQLDGISFTKESKKYKQEQKDQKLFKKATSSVIDKVDVTTANYIYGIPLNGKVDGEVIEDEYFHDSFTLQINEPVGWLNTGLNIEWQLTEEEYLKLLGMFTGLQCAIDCKFMKIIPGVDVGGLISVFSDAAVYGWYWEGKVNFIFGQDDDFGFGASYKTKYLYPMRDSDPKYVIPTIGIYLILSGL